MKIFFLSLLSLALAAAPALATPSSSQGSEADQLAEVAFEDTSATLPFANARLGVELAWVVAWADAHPDGTIIVNGHAAGHRSAAANVRLSLARAQIVRTQLVEGGVEPERIVLAAFGDRAPRVEARHKVVVWGTRPALTTARDGQDRRRAVAGR